MKIKPEHCDTENDYSCEKPVLSYSDGGRFFRVKFSRSPAMEWNQEQFYKHDSKRGQCKGFTFGSRRRMLDRLNQLSVEADLPDFVGLTLPDNCFDDCVTSFGKAAKLHLTVLLKRLRRACPSACGIWRLEWKARKSGLYVGKLFPHFHLLVWGLPNRFIGTTLMGVDHHESYVPIRDCQQSFTVLLDGMLKNTVFKSFREGSNLLDRKIAHAARCDKPPSSNESSWMSFFDWVSLAWYHVVGTGNTDHFLAGCSVERMRIWGGVMYYCAKYISKADSENFLADVPFGRNWGIFNRDLMPWAKMVQFPLADDQGVKIRRVARRYLEHRLGRRVQRHFGITIYCDVSQFKRLIEHPPDIPF
jgi:hypothetical protein